MPSPTEVAVLEILSAIEVGPGSAEEIEHMGNDAVSLTCDIASGAVPGLRSKVRTNAVALLGFMEHAQARETVQMLVNDPSPDVAIRSMRAAGRMRLASAVEGLGRELAKPELDPLLAAEAIKALQAIDSSSAKQKLADYRRATPSTLQHRANTLVRKLLGEGT